MLYRFRLLFISSSLLLLLAATGCGSGEDKTRAVYDQYMFDQKVIGKLPLYDSLVSAIQKKLPELYSKIDTTDNGYQAFRYMPGSFEEHVFSKLPPEAGTDIERFYTALGKDFIYAFDLFRDSTIKIYIKSYPVPKSVIDIEENLSYYPTGRSIRRRAFPIKDTVLNSHWQYWARFDKQGLF